MTSKDLSKKEILRKVKEISEIEFTNFKGKISSKTLFDEMESRKLDEKEFVIQVEEFFEVRIAQRNLTKILTVGDLVDHLHDII